jgi:hypothetical protein
VEIGIRHSDGHTTGSMRVTSGPGSDAEPSVPRIVAGASCQEVVATLSLMTALVFDPEAQTSPVVHNPETLPSPVARAPQPVDEARTRWEVTLGALGLGSQAGAAGGGAFAETQPASRAGTGWAPSFRLVAALSTENLVLAIARGRADWHLVGVDACPWKLGFGRDWTLRPCAAAEGGTLSVSATDVDDPRPITRPWIACGARVRAAWTPLAEGIVGVDAGGVFPLVRDEFVVAPSTSLFRAPAVVGILSAWAGVRFL